MCHLVQRFKESVSIYVGHNSIEKSATKKSFVQKTIFLGLFINFPFVGDHGNNDDFQHPSGRPARRVGPLQRFLSSLDASAWGGRVGDHGNNDDFGHRL
jgi:hypothetical protein